MDGQNISKMAHDGGVSRRRAPFLEYLRLTTRVWRVTVFFGKIVIVISWIKLSY